MGDEVFQRLCIIDKIHQKVFFKSVIWIFTDIVFDKKRTVNFFEFFKDPDLMLSLFKENLLFLSIFWAFDSN